MAEVPLLQASRWARTAFAFAVLIAPARARPQALEPASLRLHPEIAREQVVRVEQGLTKTRGRAESVRGDTLRLGLDRLGLVHRDVTLAPESRLEIRAGRGSRARGALIGAGAGAVGGLLLGLTISDAFGGSTRDGAAISVYFLPYFVPMGIIAGALLPGDRWERVTISRR